MIAFARPWFLFGLAALPAAWIFFRGAAGGGKWNLALRLAILALIASAAAAPRITAPSDRVDAVFVMDVSDSMGSKGRDAALAEINRLASGAKGDDTAALVTVAASAAVETSSRPGGAPFAPVLRHVGTGSALADGVYAAVGILPSGNGDRRIVLAGDGRDTAGGLAEAVEFAREAGITVDTIPVGPPPGRDVRVEQLIVAETVAEDEVHALTVVFHADAPTRARLLIARNGGLVGEDRLSLEQGSSRRTYEMPGLDAGLHTWEVILDAADDGMPENNRAMAVTEARGRPRILWVGHGDSAVPAALEAQGLVPDRVSPGALPDTMAGYAGRDAVILDNVSARELSLRTLDLLETWVRTRGGGLMMVGGDSSFGLGGWQGTPVERALPVDMDAPSSLYIPSLTMVLVIDKSGSMGGPADDGFSKLDIVKDAVLGAVDLLNPLFSVGLLAFDADWEWTIPVTDAGNLPAIRDGLAGLESGGGTVLYPAVKEAYARLAGSPSAVRHLVVLSDGLAEAADYDRLAAAIARDGITMSTVAVGSDADHDRLERLAEAGGGRYWYAEDAGQVPRIFASESMIVSRGLAVNETVFPQPAMAAEALSGIDLSVMPPLHGYVITYANPGSVEALRSPRGHPLLAYGRHGLGRTAVFTSDLRGGWGRDWAAWDRLPRLLAQSVRWLRAGGGTGDADLALEADGGEIRLVLEARTPGGDFRSGLRPRGLVTSPDGRELDIVMEPTAPGRYEGRFFPDSDGIWEASATDPAAGIGATARLVRNRSPELDRPGTDEAFMAEIARAGGGRLLIPGTAEAAGWWKARSDTVKTRVDLTAALGLAALILLLADIALREAAHRRRDDDDGSHRRPGEDEDMEALILKGLDDERHRPRYRRPTPAEASRILAERRQKRERGGG